LVILIVIPEVADAGNILLTVGAEGAVVVGWVVVVVLVIVNPFTSVPDCPSGLITVTFQAPIWALGRIPNRQLIVDADTIVTSEPVIVAEPFSSLVVAPVRKLVPVMPVMFTVVPAIPEPGVMPVTTGAGRGAVVVVVTGVVVGAVVAAGVATGTSDSEGTWAIFAG
jgi:hypothetical protein